MPATHPAPIVSAVLVDRRPAAAKKPFMVIVKRGRTHSIIETPHFYTADDAEAFRALSATRTPRSGNRIVMTLDCDGTAA